MRPTILFSLLLAAVSASAKSAEFDSAHGKQLVDENCYSCHGDEAYTRKDRRVVSRPGLTKQVQRCELSLGLSWFDEDINDAAGYLNQQFYHFGK